MLLEILFLSLTLPSHVTNNGILEYIRDTKYNRMVRPNTGDSADDITVTLELYSIRNIDKKSFTYNLHFSLILQWEDKRLVDAPLTSNYSAITLDQLWTPKFEITNEVSTKNGLSTQWLMTDGIVTYVRKSEAQLEWPMKLQAFPFDKVQ